MFPSRRIAIDQVIIDDSLGLCVVPRISPAQNFQYIYRAANSVRWKEEHRTLYVIPIPEWSHLKQFGSIATALALEYGVQLVTDSDTRWNEIPSELRAQIEALSK